MTRSLRILAIEDVKIAEVIARVLLTDLGHQVDLLQSADEVGAEMEFEKRRYDAIFMNVAIPSFFGLSTAINLREIEVKRGIPRTPIIGFSVHYHPKYVPICLAAGIDEVFAKPLTKELVINVLEKYCPQDKVKIV